MAQIKYLWLIVMFTLVLVVMSCTGDRRSRGVQVGNGMQSYYSEEYKFQLDYESSLKLDVLSQSNFRFYNSVSNMHIKISPQEKISNDKDLKRFLMKTIESSRLKLVNFGEVIGYLFENQYYLLSPKKDLIYAKIETNDKDYEVKLHSIIRSMVFDYQKPQINKINIHEHKVYPGSSIRLGFEFDEKKIGLNGNIYGLLKGVSFGKQLKCHKELSFELKLEKILGTNQYVATFDIPNNMCSGVYVITQFFVSDMVGNTLQLELGKKLYVGTDRKLEKVTIEILAYERMNEPQQLNVKSISLGQEKIKAGESLNLSFSIDGDREQPGPLSYRIKFYPVNRTPHNDRSIEMSGIAQPLGNKYYITTVTNPFLFSGIYQLEYFNIYDKTGSKLLLKKNHNLTHLVELIVESSLEIDTLAPTILELKTGNWKKQNFNRLYFKAIEEGSGIRSKREFRGLFMKIEGGRPIANATFVLISNVVRDKNNRYILEFFVPESVVTGEYILMTFTISDNAGNKTTLKLDETQRFYESHPEIEALKVEIK